MEVRPGLQIEEVDKIISRVEKIIMDEPDRKSCMVTYGGSGLSLGGSSASLTAYLKSDRELTTKEVVDKWKKEMRDIPIWKMPRRLSRLKRILSKLQRKELRRHLWAGFSTIC